MEAGSLQVHIVAAAQHNAATSDYAASAVPHAP